MLKIAYFINQYPKVSHSFIRREILALERQGITVQRIALRGWDADLVDAEDQREREHTQYILKQGAWALFKVLVSTAIEVPSKFFKALKQALKMGLRADRPLPFHLIYLAEACQMLAWLKASDAQHVHAHFGTNSAEVVMLAHLLGGPSYSFTVHGPEEFDKTSFIYLKDKIRHAAFVAAISSYTRSQLYRWADYQDWQKIHVVHCGLEEAFHEVEPQPIPQAPRLVCVGRLCEQKGQLLLVNAARMLANKNRDFELVLAGDGEMRGELEHLIGLYGLQDKIKITGWISSNEVREQLLSARALVLPSFAEGLPVVIMEALALRRPVLSTYVAGIPELVRDGREGFLFPAGDVKTLADTLDQFLDMPLEQVQEMGNLGRERVIARHSADVEAGKLAPLFHAAANVPACTHATLNKVEATA